MKSPMVQCNAEETDTRLWLQHKHSTGTKKLVSSPDTDVYHIGLPLLSNFMDQVILQISTPSSKECRFLHLNKLRDAFHRDPELSQIPPRTIPKVIQTLFVSTGCAFFSQVSETISKSLL